MHTAWHSDAVQVSVRSLEVHHHVITRTLAYGYFRGVLFQDTADSAASFFLLKESKWNGPPFNFLLGLNTSRNIRDTGRRRLYRISVACPVNYKGLTLNVSCKNSLRWLIRIINSDENSKSSFHKLYWRSAIVSLETYPFIYLLIKG